MGNFLEFSRIKYKCDTLSWFRNYYHLYANYAHINKRCQLCSEFIPKRTLYIQTTAKHKNSTLPYEMKPFLCMKCGLEAAELNGIEIDFGIKYELELIKEKGWFDGKEKYLSKNTKL